ncbi:MAG TPA: SprT family zinc-dependent metalloprotease [Planctomycetota bacterium]|nr:SprT family zinc-dependent metalloprotease [Planctomycetota bacterium]
MEVEVDGRHIAVEVTRSAKARWPRLEIRLHRGVRVVLPEQAPESDAEKLIRSKSAWLLRHLKRFDRLQEIVPNRRLVSGERVPVLGEELTLEVTRGNAGVERRGSILAVSAWRVRAALEYWYIAEAEREFANRVESLAGRFGIAIRRVRVSTARSKWGSCSHNGSISLNWRLMLGPSKVLDYLVAHELAHVGHPNHSAKFWARVADLCPSYEEAERWLRKNGVSLIL